MNQNQQTIGLWTATALVVGNAIGSGIFLLPSSLASFGSISLIGWIITTLGSLAIAMTFGHLSHYLPKNGGPYAYTRASFGDFAAFWVAWGYWISIWAGSAAIVTAFVAYMGVFFPILVDNSAAGLFGALATLWTLVWINSKGIKTGGRLALITTALKLLPIVSIGIVGVFFMDFDNLRAFNISGTSDFKAIVATASITLWAFLGIESAAIAGQHVENPQRNIPRATIIGTVLISAVYILSSVTIFGLIPMQDLQNSTAPFADAAASIWGPAGEYIIALGAAIACFGALNGWTILVAQMPMAASEDRLFPKEFRKLNKNGVPLLGMTLSTILVSIMVIMGNSSGLVKQFEFMILLATMSCLIPYVFSSAGFFIIAAEKKILGKKSSYSKIGIAAISFVFSVWAIAGSGSDTVFWGFILLLAGIPFYVVIQYRKNMS